MSWTVPIRILDTVMFVVFPLISSRPSTIVASTNVSPEPVATGVTVAVTESLARIIRVNPVA